MKIVLCQLISSCYASILDATYFLSKEHPLEEVKTLSSTHACYLLSGRYFAKIHNNAIKFRFFFLFLLTSIVRLGYIDFNNVIGIDLKTQKVRKLFLFPPSTGAEGMNVCLEKSYSFPLLALA
jgi:hypothetical protein